MIKRYANKLTQQAAEGKFPKKLPNTLKTCALMRLIQLDNATSIDDLRRPPSNRLEKLAGNRQEQYSIRINQQWRICFEFENGHAFNVEIIDYH